MTRSRRQVAVTQAPLVTALLLVLGPAFAEQAPPPSDEPTAAIDVVLSVDDAAANEEIDPIIAENLAVVNAALAEHQSQGRTAEALARAIEIVAVVERQYGADLHLAGPLGTLAQLQLDAADNDAAELTLGRLIGLIEHEDGVFSSDLIEPLKMLARIYADSDRREEAITLLRRARHISHRTLGILNPEQIELAESLADIYLRAGAISEGSRENRFAFRVGVHEYGADSAELVPAINRLAAWYERIGEFTLARQYYQRSIALIEKEYGADDLRLVDALQKIAGTYRKQKIYKSEGKNALIRAIDIHLAHPEADEISYAYSLTELGDWYMSIMRTDDAMEVYRRAWNVLTADGASPERGDLIFGKPKRLRYEPPIPAATRLANVSEVFVDLEFVVTGEGTVRDVSVTEATADWRTQNEIKMAMRQARFRPQFADGQPVPAKIQTRWTYALPEHLRRPVTAENPEQ